MTAAHEFPARAGQLSDSAWSGRLAGPGVGLRVGPFDLHLRVAIDVLHAPLRDLYQDHPLLHGDRVYSCRADLRHVWHLTPRPGRRVRFSVDGLTAHEDMPAGQGLAVLEWGINLAIAMRFHCFLMLHAAVLERGGRALLMPAQPGHGKTTLCAALSQRGWRLFSDEFGLVRPGTAEMVPVPRPMPLKNESIEVMRRFAPGAVFGPVIPRTRKGTIVHLKPPAESVARAEETAPAGWVVFPRWKAGVPTRFEELPIAEGFMQLAVNAFNYELLGEQGFTTISQLLGGARCFRLEYSDLEEAVGLLSRLADHDG